MTQTRPLHDGETPVDEPTVRALLRDAPSDWVNRPLRRLTTSGTEHHVWRLGDDLVVRLPRQASAEAGLVREAMWWPRLSPVLPVRVPEVVHQGSPAPGYPHRWLVTTWVPGTDAADAVLQGRQHPAWGATLADLVTALRGVDLSSVPPGDHPVGTRGGSFAERVDGLEEVLEDLEGRLDLGPVRRVLDAAAEVPTDPRVVLLHADLVPGNLVVDHTALTGLLDLGCLTTGQPAWDLTAAWWVLDAPGRAVFQDQLAVSDAEWALGRGLAVVQALLATWYYTSKGHPLATLGDRALGEACRG